MKLLCVLALGLAVVAAELSVDVTPELDRMARPEDRSVTAYSYKTHSPREDFYFFINVFRTIVCGFFSQLRCTSACAGQPCTATCNADCGSVNFM